MPFCTGFDAILSNIDEVHLTNPTANVFVFGDFNVHYKDWLTYSVGTGKPYELCYNFSITNDLTQIINVPTWILDCDSFLLFRIELFLLMLVFVVQWLTLCWEILIMLFQFPFTVCQTQKGMPFFIV